MFYTTTSNIVNNVGHSMMIRCGRAIQEAETLRTVWIAKSIVTATVHAVRRAHPEAGTQDKKKKMSHWHGIMKSLLDLYMYILTTIYILALKYYKYIKHILLTILNHQYISI